MRCSLLFGLTLVAWVSGAPSLVEPNLPGGYHELIGIPKAAQIKEYEHKILSQNKTSRIVGGDEADIHVFPYLAGLLITFTDIAGTSVCGASLVRQNRLLGAAHCWFDGVHQAAQYTVVLGSEALFSGGLRVETSNVLMHPQWTPSSWTNDIAVISLPFAVFYTNAIQPVPLPVGLQVIESFEGEWATAIGYGMTSDGQDGITSSAVARHVTMQVLGLGQCQNAMGPIAQASNICTSGAGGLGICGGDDGGPLTLIRSGHTILVGISSYVANAGCELGYPSVFTRITSFNSFINQNVFG